MSPMFAAGLGTSGARGAAPQPDSLAVEAAIGEVAEAMRAILTDGPHPELVERADLTFGLGFKNLDVQGALQAALANVRNLLLVHGRLRSRPPIRLEPSEVRPKLAENGKPGVFRLACVYEPTWEDHAPETTRWVEVRAVAKRKDLYPNGAYCRLEYEPNQQDVLNERGEYVVWRAGLVALAEALHGRLERYSALPPVAAATPWLGEADGAPIRDVFAPGAEGVYRGDEASALNAQRAASRRRRVSGGNTYARRFAKPAKSADRA
jgi:hypothetical protein